MESRYSKVGNFSFLTFPTVSFRSILNGTEHPNIASIFEVVAYFQAQLSQIWASSPRDWNQRLRRRLGSKNQSKGDHHFSQWYLTSQQGRVGTKPPSELGRLAGCSVATRAKTLSLGPSGLLWVETESSAVEIDSGFEILWVSVPPTLLQ